MSVMMKANILNKERKKVSEDRLNSLHVFFPHNAAEHKICIVADQYLKVDVIKRS
jgi:hypothetical protein